MKTTTKYHLFICSLFFTVFAFAQRGKTGALTVNTANRIVNEYTALTANAAIGATSISVTSSNLNTNSRFTAPLAAGDLIMIIQMQGASIPGVPFEFPAGSGVFYGIPNDYNWGQVSNYNNCGNYEFAQVNSVPNSTTINLDCGLIHAYTASGKVQVIRVPRYSSLTINAPGSIIAQAWNGIAGGVVAIENLGNTIINVGNAINTSGQGFRGGALSPNNSAYGGGQHAMQLAAEGAEKGEGVVGYQADYNIYGGRYCRGEAGNAGGGGNNHNAAGGGGSNAGSLVGYDGMGNPDVSGGAGWVNAWDLEGGTFSTHTSPGGGRGGYTFCSGGGTNRNATTLAPGNTTWGGDNRRNVGGLGGHNLDYSTGKIFMGGGGGAGDRDNSAGGAGGTGGGLIYLMSYGTVSGTGSIVSNGANGGNSGIDGAGGAGGGGTVIINSVGAISGITINANGGTGGNQVVSNPIFSYSETEGPGGGGGGGYIAISNGAPTQVANGGTNGTTNSNMVTEFPPNGATRGGLGLTNQLITWDTIHKRDTTICSGNSVTLFATMFGTVPPGTTILWYNSLTGGTAIGSGSTYTTPVLTATTSFFVGFCPGTYRKEIIVTIINPPNATINQQSPLCVTAAPFILGAATAGGTWSGTGITNATTGTFDPATAGAGSHIITYTLTAPCLATDTMTIVVIPTPDATIAQVGALCEIDPAITLSAVTSGGTWAGVGITNGITGTFLPSAAGTGSHIITYSITSPCPATDTVLILVNQTPNATIAQSGPYCVTSPATNLSAATGGGTWSGTGITNAATGTFTPSVAGVGTHLITYSIGGACPHSDTILITVIQLPDATINQSGPYCVGAPSINLTAITSGGTWTGTGITNGTNGTFDPATAGIGSHIITYTLYSPCVSTDTVTIVVNNIANASITPAGPFCSNDPSVNLSAATSGGTWTGSGITNSANGTFNPATAGVGTHVITYTIGGVCPGIDSITVTVNSLANAAITPAGPYCVSNGMVTLSAATSGGTWSGTGIVNGINGDFDPATAGVGSHVITYTLGGLCPAIDSITIAVTLNADATITQVGPYCVGASNVNLTASTAGGTWTGTGITNGATGTFDPTIAGVGSHVITYTITGACAALDTVTIVVNSPKDATITAAGPYCVSSPSVILNAVSTGGTWSGVGITNVSNGTFDPATAGVGSHIVSYNISGLCPSNDTMTIVVIPVANATINPVNPLCVNAAAFNLTAAQPGGVWSGTGITNTASGTFDPSLSGVGTFVITYAIYAQCGDTATQTIVVNPLPTPNVVSNVSQGCVPLCVQYNESTGANCTSILYNFGDGNTSSSSSPTHCYSTAGVYNVSITCTDANNCSATSTVNNMVTVFSLPVASISPDVSIYEGASTTLGISGGATYNWFSGTGLSCTTCTNPVVSPLQTTTYCVEVANSDGCVDTACVTVTVDDKLCMGDNNLGIPNAFSPNNDGINDEFCLQGWEACVNVFYIAIYDRWGEKLYESKDPAFCWNGKFRGVTVDAQVCVYYIAATLKNNSSLKRKGNISVIR